MTLSGCTIETRWHFRRKHWGKSGCNEEAQLRRCARWGGGRGSRNFLSLLKTEEKKFQHKPAHRRGKWFSGPVLPEEQAALLDIMSSHQNNDFKKKQAVTLTLWSQQVQDQRDRPMTPSSDSECQAGRTWSQTSGLQRPGGENTEGSVFLSFGPDRPGLAPTGSAWLGVLQLGKSYKSLTQSNITGLSRPGPEGLAPAHCLYNHWEFPHIPNLIFSFFFKYVFCLGTPFNYSSVSHSFSIRHPRQSFPLSYSVSQRAL